MGAHASSLILWYHLDKHAYVGVYGVGNYHGTCFGKLPWRHAWNFMLIFMYSSSNLWYGLVHFCAKIGDSGMRWFNIHMVLFSCISSMLFMYGHHLQLFPFIYGHYVNNAKHCSSCSTHFMAIPVGPPILWPFLQEDGGACRGTKRHG